MKIDILLPIYNSPNETSRCIDSIMRSTNINMFNLYLLDDCSTDSKISDITNFYSSKYRNCKVIRNKKNLGFPNNVNNGIHISDNDVVILNSDTIVTENWLERLYLASISRNNIGAVGPLSNYGIISSVPTVYPEVNNKININQIIKYLHSYGNSIYPETPVLIGFCMYITRKAINDVGTFDSATFKKGYGEEVDWCLRARKRGYKLIIADDVFVYHEGGISFGKEKESLLKTSAELINERYPYYQKDVKTFERNHPLVTLRVKMSKQLNVPIKFRLKYYLRRKKYLILINR